MRGRCIGKPLGVIEKGHFTTFPRLPLLQYYLKKSSLFLFCWKECLKYSPWTPGPEGQTIEHAHWILTNVLLIYWINWFIQATAKQPFLHVGYTINLCFQEVCSFSRSLEPFCWSAVFMVFLGGWAGSPGCVWVTVFPRHVTLLGGLSTDGLGSPLCSGGGGRDAQWGRWSGGGRGSTSRLRGFSSFSSRPRNHLSSAGLVAQNLGTPGRGDIIFSITVSLLSSSRGNEKSAGILNGGITTVDTCQVIQSLLTQFLNFVSYHHLLSLLARGLFGRVSRVYQDVSSVYQKFKKEQWVFDSLQDDRADKWKSSWLPMFFGEAGRKSYSSYASPVVDIKYLCHRLWLDFLIYNQFARKISGLVLMLIGWWWKPWCKKLPLSISWPGSNILFKSNFIPAVVGPFLSGLDYFGRESAIFGARSQWSGEIAIFHPHIARNCYISPSYCFPGKRFCGVRIIGIGEPIMLGQEEDSDWPKKSWFLVELGP